MALEIECVVDGGVSREEALGRSRSLETDPRSFASAGRLVRIFGAIIQPAADRDEHLVQAPGAAWTQPHGAELPGVGWPEPGNPASDRLVAQIETPFSQEILDVRRLRLKRKYSQTACWTIDGG